MQKRKSVRQQVRAGFLWAHRWLGIISGIIVFIVAITGCLYVFEEEGRSLFQGKYLTVAPGENDKLPLSTLVPRVRGAFPAEQITQIRMRSSAEAAYIFNTKSSKAISVNPYSGEITGVRNMKTDFFSWILKMHRELHMGKVGKEIIRWNVLIFFIMCVSGLVLWWPKQRRFFKQAISIKFRTKNFKRLNWDLHSVLGFYSLLVLFIISLTGMFFVFDWTKNAVRFVTGSEQGKEKKLKSKPAGAALFPMEDALAAAVARFPLAEEVIITNPADSTAPIRVMFRYPYTIVRNHNTAFFDKYSGKLLREDLYSKASAYDKVARANYDLHVGNLGLGIGSKIIYFLASLFAASLPVTGILIWLGRGKKRKKPVKISDVGDVSRKDAK